MTAVVDRVTRFKVGDWVMGTFMQNWVDGPMTPTTVVSALGGSVDGRLTAYAVLDEDGLVLTPSHLSDTEAVTLPCAAVTAWHSLVEVGGPGTMERSITATRIAGTIGVIGTLPQGSVNPMSFMQKDYVSEESMLATAICLRI